MVLHRLSLSPWAYASLPLVSHSASSLRLWFSFLSVFVDIRFFVATLKGHSRDVCGSTAADSSSADGGTCIGTRSRDLDFCCLPDYQDLHQVQ